MMKKKMKRRIIFLIMILTGFLILYYYWIESKGKKILTFAMFVNSNWDVPGDKTLKIVEDAIEKFEKKYPDIKVEYESGILKEDYSEWLTSNFLTGNEPDVFMITKEDFSSLSSKGALLNLDKLIKEDKEFSKSSYYSALIESGQYEKVQYALPYESVPVLMCVNKTLLEKAGIEMPKNNWTWGDFHKICRKVTRDKNNDGKIDQFGVYNYSWEDAAYSNGASLFNEEGTENYISNRKVVNAVNFVYKINALTKGYTVTKTDFESGRVAFYPMLFSEYKTYKTYPWKVERYTNFDWTCITMPAGPEGDNISELDSLLGGISSRTNKKELAWEFLKLLTYDEEIQKKISIYSKGVSPLKKIVESNDTCELSEKGNQEELEIEFLEEVMKKGVTIPKFQKYEKALLIMNEGVMEAMESDKNIYVSMITLEKKIKNYLMNGK